MLHKFQLSLASPNLQTMGGFPSSSAAAENAGSIAALGTVFLKLGCNHSGDDTLEATMHHRLLHAEGRQRTFALVLETGDEVMGCLLDFARREEVSAAQIAAIGALSDAVLGYFDWQRKDYLHIAVSEQVEVAALLGDVALSPSGKPAVHIHLVLGKRDGTAMAGHLIEGHLRPTLEVILTESPAHLRKVYDEVTGLALIRPEC